MAGSTIRISGQNNSDICEFVVDTIEEIKNLPTTTKKGTGDFEGVPGFGYIVPIGSTCIVGNGDDDILIYMLFSNGWKQI